MHKLMNVKMGLASGYESIQDMLVELGVEAGEYLLVSYEEAMVFDSAMVTYPELKSINNSVELKYVDGKIVWHRGKDK